jgi:gliding motility associated protien GldN
MLHFSFSVVNPRVVCPMLFLLGLHLSLFSQSSETATPEPEAALEMTEVPSDIPLDDIARREILTSRQPLAYAPVREADIAWEMRVWRVIDAREKINQPFMAPNSLLFYILSQAALSGDLRVYSTQDDRFSKPLYAEDISSMLYRIDTIVTLGGEDFSEEQVKIVRSEIDWEAVKRFRIKEVWYFDKNTSTVKVRILGIAPMVDEVDEDGNFKYERPLFWVHYPSARPFLARHKAIMHAGNDASTLSWEDLFESRRFNSTIYKQSNLLDLRISDYKSGVDMLQEAEKFKEGLLAWEHDLWSY